MPLILRRTYESRQENELVLPPCLTSECIGPIYEYDEGGCVQFLNALRYIMNNSRDEEEVEYTRVRYEMYMRRYITLLKNYIIPSCILTDRLVTIEELDREGCEQYLRGQRYIMENSDVEDEIERAQENYDMYSRRYERLLINLELNR
jgi:hypothetical protein